MVLLAGAAVLAACSGGGTGTDDQRAEPSSTPAPSASTPLSSTDPAPTTAPAPAPVFDGRIAPIDEAVRARMAHSWRPGCPVPLEDLRLLTLDHWGYDGVEHRGELVVHADQAEGVLGAFRALFDARFPIERMELVDAYGGDDRASTLANNTAGFNCRDVVGRPGTWSQHAYGRAIDVNPLVNPYVLDPSTVDPAQQPYVDRSIDAPGLIRAGDEVTAAFAAVGWQWGGTWPAPDYQHFSATGR